MQGEENITKNTCRLPFQAPENPAINRITTKKEKNPKTQKKTQTKQKPNKKTPPNWRDVTVSTKDFVAVYSAGEQVCLSFPGKFTHFEFQRHLQEWSMGKKTKPEVSLFM